MKRLLIKSVSVLLVTLFIFPVYGSDIKSDKKYIRWIDFTVTENALRDSSRIDIETYGEERHVNWIELLACLGAKYGGEFKRYKKCDLESVVQRYKNGEEFRSVSSSNLKLYDYYLEAYSAVLGGVLGKHKTMSPDGTMTGEYGIMAFSPIAKGYYYSHFDDFGSSRSFGYRRVHLGHDLMGSIGTPIIAVEGGYVEACGWNRFGGWRIGIRSFDGKRYYYYAHLRKNHPYNDIYEGKTVYAGEVIGYLGMTGYSSKENTNNINVPHLHYGLQVIFDPSQKDGVNQIWIDMYALTNFLYGKRAEVYSSGGEFVSKTVCIGENTFE